MFNRGETYGQGFQKSILIILFLFLSVALVITWSVPSTGFESSIYNSTPLVLWIALISSVIVGISVVIQSASTFNFGRGNLWKYGFLLIFLCYAIGLSLFIVRGYYMWALTGDPSGHIGWSNDILQTGHIPKIIFYPITHIFLSEISLVTNLSPSFFYLIIPFFFGLLCVVFMFFFVRVLSSHQIEPVIAGILACTFTYGWYFILTPNGLANLLFPMVLFLMFKYLMSNKFSWAILLCISLILYPVFHPLPSIMLALILITLWIPHKVHDVWDAIREKNPKFLNTKRININVLIPFLILTIWFIFWYSFYSIWGITITEVYQKIMAEGGPTQLTGVTHLVGYAQGYGYNVVEIFLKMYGNLLVFSILSIISFFLLWKKVSKGQKEGNIFSLYGPWAVLCIFVPALYYFNLPFGPLRFLFYLFILETVFVAYLISYTIIKSRESKSRFLFWLTKVVLVVLVAGLFLSGLINLYPSPYNMTISAQSTQSEVAGMVYFLEYRNITIPVSGFGTAVGRFADFLLTKEKRSEQHLPQYINAADYPPWHFGYTQFPSIAYLYQNETYLIIQQKDKLRYIDYFPEMAKYRFTVGDFERLNSDSGANLLYSNGGFDFLIIVPKR